MLLAESSEVAAGVIGWYFMDDTGWTKLIGVGLIASVADIG
jgi:hypothetical protein